MAYAAGLGDTLACYLDTRRPEGIVAHPCFPVCLEWPAILAVRGHAGDLLTTDEALRAVHATHDLIIHRSVRPGDRLTTRAMIVGVERRKPGAYQVIRLETVDAAGASVCTTWQGGLYLGVEVAGPDCPAANAPSAPSFVEGNIQRRSERRVPISGLAAHVYSECARIWNPIHTDLAVATRIGLPGLILHGTATLALAVSRILEREADNNPGRIRRIAGRFSAMVRIPSEITVCILARQAAAEADIVRFEVRNSEGELAVSNGLIALGA